MGQTKQIANGSKWHNAENDLPKNCETILIRVEKDGSPNDVAFILGYFSGYEYCSDSALRAGGKVEITHYDNITHWIELS